MVFIGSLESTVDEVRCETGEYLFQAAFGGKAVHQSISSVVTFIFANYQT